MMFQGSIRKLKWILFLCIISLIPDLASAQVTADLWHGFVRSIFTFKGRKAWVVMPNKPLPGKPWIWNAHFPDWHTEVDSILLSRGFHVVYLNTNDMYGSPEAMQVWDSFYEHMVRRWTSQKVALEGVSRAAMFTTGSETRSKSLHLC
jgi:sialidase-1